MKFIRDRKAGLIDTGKLKVIFFWALLACVLGTGLAGCFNWVVENAFEGEYSETKNNRLINGYCQNCHIHKDFVPAPHIQAMGKKYKSRFFRSAAECRSCHYIEKGFTDRDFSRKTRYPSAANKGYYKDFEVYFPEPGEEDEEEIKDVKEVEREQIKRAPSHQGHSH